MDNSIKRNSTGVAKKVVWNFQGIAGISKKNPMVLVQIRDGISIGGVKIPSKMCGNSRGEGKKS